jgi:RNA polymerase sigma factor (sigma-70 family)
MATREATLARLIEEEWPKLRRYFRTLVPESDVLDLVQSTMLAYVESDGPSDPAKERAYLWGIAWRQSQRYYEKHSRKNVPFDSAVHTASQLDGSFTSQLDRRDRLVAALHSIPLQQQSATILRHCEGLTLEEVAEALELSLATVKRYLTAAEQTLRGELGTLDGLPAAYEKL